MGATTFVTVGHGNTPEEAYQNAKEEAIEDFECDYEDCDEDDIAHSGTIATTSGFFIDTSLKSLEKEDVDEWVSRMVDKTEKWGSCACTYLAGDEFLFAGWAAE